MYMHMNNLLTNWRVCMCVPIDSIATVCVCVYVWMKKEKHN